MQNNVWYGIILSVYLAAVYTAVGLPTIMYFRFDISLNLLPFFGMVRDWKNSIFNIALFMPLGAALPLMYNKFASIKRLSLFSFAVSLAIEILQIFTFRATDINDLITNTLVAALGGLIVKYVMRKHHIHGRENCVTDLYISFGATIAVMFFVQPYIAPAIWSLLG